MTTKAYEKMKIHRRVIYTMTVIQERNQSHGMSRTWGWFLDFGDAEQAVLQNAGDMFECGYYQKAVIEEVTEGSLAMSKNEWWYEASYDEKFGTTVRKIEKPHDYKNIVHFAMG
jgi:hypothetical protein